jgi:flagella basal body P-ring formation protein FlgA
LMHRPFRFLVFLIPVFFWPGFEGAAEGKGATELHIRPLISPTGETLRAEEVFRFYSPVPRGEEISPPPLNHKPDRPGSSPLGSLFSHTEIFPTDIFSDTPAVVPVWQIRRLLQELMDRDKSGIKNPSLSVSASSEKAEITDGTAMDPGADFIAVVGKPAIYLPKSINTPGERTFYVRALEKMAGLARNDAMRIELSLERFPAHLEAAVVVSADPLFAASPGGVGSFGQGGPSEGGKPFFKKGGPVRFLCRFEKGGEILEKVITAESALFLPLPQASQHIKKGETVTFHGQNLVSMPVSAVPENYRIKAEGRYTAKSDIERGEVLSLLNLRVKPDVEVGDSVRVSLRQGSVLLKMPGVARGTGSYGETVAVRLASGIVRDCRIERNGEVRIEEP